MRLGCWNVGGWSLKDAKNKHFREQTLLSSNCDIFCIVETFLKNKDTLYVSGYTYYTQNRLNINKRAKRGSRGVGVFIRHALFNQFSVFVLYDNVEDILWLKLAPLRNYDKSNRIVLCVAYLPLWSIAFIKCNGEADADLGSGSNEQITRSIYNTANIPADFLTSPDSLNMVNETIRKMENSLNQERDVK